MGLWQKIASSVAAVGICAVAVTVMSQPVNGAAQDIHRPYTATVTIEGATQGQIADQSHPIRLVAYNHEIVSPRDAASGLPTGKRMHKPFVITKELDKSSPLLMRALVTNEALKSVVLTYAAGQTHYTVRLTNAAVADIQQNSQSAGLPLESISFTYQKIEWTWDSVDGKTMAMDDWESPQN